MNGVDHALPDTHTAAVARALQDQTDGLSPEDDSRTSRRGHCIGTGRPTASPVNWWEDS